jgi:GntR family transcriptional regulator
MGPHWNDKDPLFLQIRELILGQILDGVLAEEQQLPSVRRVAADLEVNPLTVMKAYQLLVDDGVVEKRRGLGMFVRPGAVEELRLLERRRFLEQEWPALRARLRRLGLSPGDLPAPTGDEEKGVPR